MAAPPAPRETYVTALATLRQLIARWRTAENPDDALEGAIRTQEAMTEIADRFATSIATLEDNGNHAGNGSTGGEPWKQIACRQ